MGGTRTSHQMAKTSLTNPFPIEYTMPYLHCKAINKQNQGMTSIEITDQNIKSFERVARKYGVDFAVQKDKSMIPPKYIVFFKGRDADAITAAFTEFTATAVKKAARPSVLTQLKKFTELVKNTISDRIKNKEKEQSR